jgi:ribose 5-phosphate isomerase B
MRVHLGSDHAGYEVKNQLAEVLRGDGHEVVDHGPFSYDADDDYPVFCLRAADAVARDSDSLGVVIGGSGNGEQIAANKVRGVRAALAWSDETARLSRDHNDAQVLSIGARMHTFDEVARFVATFLATPFSGDERHARRIAMVNRYEEAGALPPLESPVPGPDRPPA